MNDSFGRKIEYLRISLTERCQQKCTYCSSSHGGDCVKQHELSADDFIFIAEICADLGFKKIRLTGGEPLLRRDLTEIVKGISGLGAFNDIALTTNAQMLAEQADELKKAGLKRCNISLDSLRSDTYRKITGSELPPVFDGIRKAYNVFGNIKINTVLIKNVNDNEAGDFIKLAEKYPIDVRFIELMPMGNGGEGVKTDEILAVHKELKLCENENPCAPAVYYKGENFAGRVGFISPISHKFCESCNRLRVTSDGTVRPCLGSNEEFSIRSAVLDRDRVKTREIIESAIRAKPQKSCFGGEFKTSRTMNRIGG